MQWQRIVTKAIAEGIDAYCHGQPRTTCPYEPDTREHQDWLLGWDEAAKLDRDLATLISDVHAAIGRLRSGAVPEQDEKLTPAVPIKKSVTPDHIVCLDDGKKFKSLKRHLARHHGLTPDEYRAKWGLSPDYPMVAPAYAEARSSLAKSMGLGRKSGTVSTAREKTVKGTRDRAAAATMRTIAKPSGRKKADN